MRRREFVALLGSAAASWPLGARAQQPAMMVIGVLGGASHTPQNDAALHRGLKDIGFIAGQNLAIEYRWADGHYDRLPALAADLVVQQVAAIIAAGGSAPAQAAKAATEKIPIVFVSGGDDPVKDGLVASLNRPGGNVTGVNVITSALGPKRFELLHQLVPKATVIGILMNPNYVDADLQMREIQNAAGAVKLTLSIANASTERELETAFAALAKGRVEALFVANDPYFTGRRDQIIALAAQHGIPAMYSSSDWVAAGGLVSYGADFVEGYRQAGGYVGRILKGEKPADLPVMRSTKFQFVINLNTTKTLSLEIPPTLLALADEVIE
jgi:putative ABC transport system substrate-binding protein